MLRNDSKAERSILTDFCSFKQNNCSKWIKAFPFAEEALFLEKGGSCIQPDIAFSVLNLRTAKMHLLMNLSSGTV